VTIRRIVTIGDPVLTALQAGHRFRPRTAGLLQDMKETMYAAPGVGLAANQIGVDLAVAVIDLTIGEEPGRFFVIANPRITVMEGNSGKRRGASPSPTSRGDHRPAKVKVAAQDEHGWSASSREGLMARRCAMRSAI